MYDSHMIDVTLLEASESLRVRQGVGPAVRALWRDSFGPRLQVIEGVVVVRTDGGPVPLLTHLKAWARTPAAAPFLAAGGEEAESGERPTQEGRSRDRAQVTEGYLFLRWVDGIESDDLAEAVEGVADGIESILQEAEHRSMVVRRDYQEAAMVRELGVLGQRTAEQISAVLDVTTQRLAREVESGESILSHAFRHRLPSDVNQADSLAAEAEARALVRDLDPLERQGLYHAAARRGDRQTVRAFELAPVAFPLVTGDEIAEGAELFAQAVDPDRYARLSEVRQALQVIQATGTRANEALSRLMVGGEVKAEPAADPLDEIIGG